jgi:methionyl aminopeptidase
VPNFGKAGCGPKLKPGMTIAIEPMINMGRAHIRVLKDKWTVVTVDGKLSAHFEHTVLITDDEPELLTARPGFNPALRRVHSSTTSAAVAA